MITERLLLRPFVLSDAPAVQRIAGAHEVAYNTLLIPHPYPDGAAEAWITRPRGDHELSFAITLRGSDEIVGGMSLIINRDHNRGEIGYYVGVPYWGRGYATEAGRAVLRHAFADLGLNRVHAEVFSRNAASGRVLQKLGMRHEGTQRKHIVKWGEPIDIECYGILREEWDAAGR